MTLKSVYFIEIADHIVASHHPLCTGMKSTIKWKQNFLNLSIDHDTYFLSERHCIYQIITKWCCCLFMTLFIDSHASLDSWKKKHFIVFKYLWKLEIVHDSRNVLLIRNTLSTNYSVLGMCVDFAQLFCTESRPLLFSCDLCSYNTKVYFTNSSYTILPTFYQSLLSVLPHWRRIVLMKVAIF